MGQRVLELVEAIPGRMMLCRAGDLEMRCMTAEVVQCLEQGLYLYWDA